MGFEASEGEKVVPFFFSRFIFYTDRFFFWGEIAAEELRGPWQSGSFARGDSAVPSLLRGNGK